LEGLLAKIISFLSSPAVYTPIFTALVGGVLAIFKPFLLKEEDLSRRVDFHKQKLVERLSHSYKKILRAAFALAPSPGDPDPVLEHVNDLLRVTSIINRMARYQENVRRYYNWLLITIMVGALAVLNSCVGEDCVKAIVTIISLFVLVGQITAVILIRNVNSKLKEIEDIT
jgi:hypothetical protein